LEVSGQLHAPDALPQEKEPSVPTEYEACWALKLVWTTWSREKSCPYQDPISNFSAIQININYFSITNRPQAYKLVFLAIITYEDVLIPST
jgi:hypothetical protein